MRKLGWKICLGVLLVGLSFAGQVSPAAAGSELVQVLAPRDEGFSMGPAVTIRARVAKGAKVRSAELNGAGVKGLLRRQGGVLVASIRTGERALRPGRNFLRLVVARGKARDYRTVAFTRVAPAAGLVRRFKAAYERDRGLHVVVAAAKLHAKVRVELNGRNVSPLFGGGQLLRRAAVLGGDDGLRHGRNVLTVRVTHFDGGIRKLRRVFSVPRGVTVAAAGPAVTVQAGAVAQLHGGSSLPALNSGGKPAAGDLRFAWKLVSGPRGSRPRLSGAGTGHPRLRADRPGHYLVQLTTRMGSAKRTASVDTAEVTVEPQPFAAVDTMANVGGKDGIAIEATRECEAGQPAAEPPCFFANPGSEGEVQVLVLDRQTLSPISNTAYPSADLGSFADRMQGFISSPGTSSKPPVYETDKLVVISSRGGSVADAAHLAEGLSVFNNDDKGYPQELGGLAKAGPFSLIAVPGTLEGKAALNFGSARIVAPDGSADAPGALVGALKVGSDEPGAVKPELVRGFAWPDAIPYDTRAENETAFRLGAEKLAIVPPGLPADADGLAVFSFDPVNPAGSLARAAFVGPTGGQGSEAGLEWVTLVETLKAALEKGLGVAIVSSGELGRFGSEPQAGSFATLQRQLEVLGVNPDILARAVMHDGTYSMISAGLRPGEPQVPGEFRAGYSASSVLAEGVPEGEKKLTVGSGRLTGVLQRTAYGALFPANGAPTGTPPEAEMLETTYQRQVPWPLTPSVGASGAGCQQVAFAYLARNIPGLFPADELPVLWSGSNATACEGVDHTGVAGPRSAADLSGNSCAQTEPSAIGAEPVAVRQTAMTLRRAYLAVDARFNTTQIENEPMPSGAPFTAADLACAKSQMVDEIADREQVMALMEVLRAPQARTQGKTVTELGAIAEEVEAALLASAKAKLAAPPNSTASFWVTYSLQMLSNVASIGAFDAPALAKDGFEFLNLASSTGQTGFILAEGPPANPVDATDQYLLLAAQLHEEDTKVENQIENVLTAQENGTLLTEEILLSDPGKLATAAANARGKWQVSTSALQVAQDAYLYRVRQLANQAFWPQAYSGVRINYQGACQQGGGGCWNGSEWVNGASTPDSLPEAGPEICMSPKGEWLAPFSGAGPGSPVGLGASNEYLPLAEPTPEGLGPPSYLDYLMLENQSLGSGQLPNPVSASVVAPFFAQPVDSFEDPVQNGNAPAGFYPPEFWWQNMSMSKRFQCSGSGFSVKYTEPGGPFREVLSTGDEWPTPPSAYCVKESVNGEPRGICTYDQSFYREQTLNLPKLVRALGGNPGSSGVWLQAYGGAGATGGSDAETSGDGGAGGIARTYYSSADAAGAALGSPTLHYFVGEAGQQSEGVGGAATVVASADITTGAEKPRPCVLADPNAINGEGKPLAVPTISSSGSSCSSQNIVLIAAGGGGGGHEAGTATSGYFGKNGGNGGVAIAGTQTASAAGAAGGAHKGSHQGHPGFNGAGGAAASEGGGTAGGNGIGGLGGPASGGPEARWLNASGFFGSETFGAGGTDGDSKGGHGGGGGGGFGGGAGGADGGHTSSGDDYGGSGGSGGGSYAFKGDAPPADQPSRTPPGRNGALVVVVDGVDSGGPLETRRLCPSGGSQLTILYRGLAADNTATSCGTARRLAAAASRQPTRLSFSAQGFRCRSPRFRRRAPGAHSRARRSNRWFCAYSAAKSGYAKVVFTLPGSRSS